MQYNLTDLMTATEHAISMADMHHDDFQDEAINWGALRCIDAWHITHEGGDVSYAVVIEEVSPDSWNFQQFIAMKLREMGFDNLDVITEW